MDASPCTRGTIPGAAVVAPATEGQPNALRVPSLGGLNAVRGPLEFIAIYVAFSEAQAPHPTARSSPTSLENSCPPTTPNDMRLSLSLSGVGATSGMRHTGVLTVVPVSAWSQASTWFCTNAAAAFTSSATASTWVQSPGPKSSAFRARIAFDAGTRSYGVDCKSPRSTDSRIGQHSALEGSIGMSLDA